MENGFIESFNNRLRGECLNTELFDSVLHARAIINEWKHQYNARHLHSALTYQSPSAYAEKNRSKRLQLNLAA